MNEQTEMKEPMILTKEEIKSLMFTLGNMMKGQEKLESRNDFLTDKLLWVLTEKINLEKEKINLEKTKMQNNVANTEVAQFCCAVIGLYIFSSLWDFNRDGEISKNFAEYILNGNPLFSNLFRNMKIGKPVGTPEAPKPMTAGEACKCQECDSQTIAESQAKDGKDAMPSEMGDQAAPNETMQQEAKTADPMEEGNEAISQSEIDKDITKHLNEILSNQRGTKTDQTSGANESISPQQA